MSQPVTYDRVYNFAEFQALNPTAPLPADKIDLEYNTIKITLDQTLANLALIQRDDGQLGTQTVGFDQLKTELSIGISPATTWVTGVNYQKNDAVFFGVKMYRCLVSHISGVFATDLAAAKWLLVADFSTLVSSTGVSSLGNAQGAITILGGNLPSNVLTMVRYDAAQSLSGAQTLQVRQNVAAAPITPDYVVGVANSELSAERVLTNTATVTWDISVGGQAKANLATVTGDYVIGHTSAEAPSGRVPTNTASLTWDVSVANQVKANVVFPTIVNTIDGVGGAYTTGNGITSAGGAIGLTTARRTLPTRQIFSIAGSTTYFTPAGCLWIRVRVQGGGGGGGGGNNSAASTAGGQSSFSGGTLVANGGGTASAVSGPSVGGSTSGGNVLSLQGGSGGGAVGVVGAAGGQGGSSVFGGSGAGAAGNQAGTAASNNSGAGGGGGGGNATSAIGGGGGAGGYIEHVIVSPAASYALTVGGGGAGANGTSAGNGGSGATGIIIVEEFYGS